MTVADVKSRSFIAHPHEVLAILEARQTQFRRVVKPQPAQSCFNAPMSAGDWAWPRGKDTMAVTISNKPNGPDGWVEEFCPYGIPGDLLHVREALRQREDGRIIYDIDKSLVDLQIIPDTFVPSRRYVPQSLMPRWAARLWLRIVNVRVERLRNISGFDACAEGYPGLNDTASIMHHGEGKKARRWFREMGDSLNTNPNYSWDSNPWVWVVEFERAEKPE